MGSPTPDRNKMPVGASVLIVDDEAGMVRYLHRVLEKLGYRIAGTVRTAAESQRPDVVIMDVVLEDWTAGICAGAEIWNRLSIPVVLATARADRAALDQLARMPPMPCLFKPFTEKELEEALEHALRGRYGG